MYILKDFINLYEKNSFFFQVKVPKNWNGKRFTSNHKIGREVFDTLIKLSMKNYLN